jgi:hypothetical protein
MPVAINAILILKSEGNPHIWVSGLFRRVLTWSGGCLTPFLECLTPVRVLDENHPCLERGISYARA